MQKFFLALVFMCANNIAQAQYISGQEYIGWLDARDRLAINKGSGLDEYYKQNVMSFTLGVADAGDGLVFCIPKDVIAGQLEAIVIKYVRASPEYWNQPAAQLIMNALHQAFPCKKK